MRNPAAMHCGTSVALAVALLAAIAACPRGALAAASDLALGRAEARLASRFASRGIAYPPQAATFIALKSEGRLELWSDDAAGRSFVRSYLVRATSGRLGPKLRQGDHQVPEGVYKVSALNPRSHYHLSLRLDYPNAYDQARGIEDGRGRLGGDIMIHGDRVSDGCLPVGDEGIEELFALASRVGIENVTVVIAPLDLRRSDARPPAVASSRAPRWLGELYGDIARALAAFPLPSSRGGASNPTPPARASVTAPKCRPYDAADCVVRCNQGDAASCARAGVQFRDGRGVAADAERAWRLLGTACARGDAVGCSALSELLLSDEGVRRDTSRAAALARSACDGGDGHGCARLASLCSDELFYPSKPGECDRGNVDRLRRRAVARLEPSCSGWGAFDCFTLATIYATGDRATALRFANDSCRAGDPGGCDELGALYEQQGEMPRARALYEKACGAGYTRSCTRIAAGTIATVERNFGG